MIKLPKRFLYSELLVTLVWKKLRNVEWNNVSIGLEIEEDEIGRLSRRTSRIASANCVPNEFARELDCRIDLPARSP